MVKIKKQRTLNVKAPGSRPILLCGLAAFCSSLLMVPQVIAGTPGKSPATKAKAAVPAPPKVAERLASGSLVGHPFDLVAATYTANTIVLDGGEMVAGDASKGHSKIVIEFSKAQAFANQTYRIRYNATQAIMADSQTKAPTVTYTSVDKANAVSSTTATNGSKSDHLDYAMELRFYPLDKKGQLPGVIRLQIGSSPVSDVKGYFCATH